MNFSQSRLTQFGALQRSPEQSRAGRAVQAIPAVPTTLRSVFQECFVLFSFRDFCAVILSCGAIRVSGPRLSTSLFFIFMEPCCAKGNLPYTLLRTSDLDRHRTSGLRRVRVENSQIFRVTLAKEPPIVTLPPARECVLCSRQYYEFMIEQ